MPEERAQFDDAELRGVLKHYEIGTILHIQDFPRGSPEAAKVLIKTDRGRFLLKRRPKGKDDPYRVAFAHELQNYLASKAYPLPHLIGTRADNNSMLRYAGAMYEMFEFIPAEGYDPTSQATREAGKMLALFHRLIGQMACRFEPPSGYYHDSQRVRGLLERIGQTLADSPGAPSARGRAAAAAELCAALRGLYDRAGQAARSLGLEHWDKQIVHCDWHPGNVLFHEHHVAAVLDYDSARMEPRVSDIANGALQFSMQRGDRNPETWPAACDEQRLADFVGGYDEQDRISQAELQCVGPLMIEALVAESVGPVAATGHFARLDGFVFLRTILRKVVWLEAHQERLVQRLAC